MRQLINKLLSHFLCKILINRMEMDDLVTVYVTLIIKGYKTFSQVPVNLQPAVEAELLALGLGRDGKPLLEEPTQA